MGEVRQNAVLFGLSCQAAICACAASVCAVQTPVAHADESALAAIAAPDVEPASPTAAGALIAADATQPPSAIDARPTAVAQTVRGILSYTRWPVMPKPVRLCVLGATGFADQLLTPASSESPPGAEVNWQASRLPLGSDRISTDCDAAYIGTISDNQWRELLPRLIGRPILTICEQRTLCEAGGMFCLDVRSDGVSFTVNLDSMARSPVRVHPNVLKLGQRKGKPT